MGLKVTTETWPTWSSIVAAPSSPDSYTEAAMERLTKKIEPYIVRVRGVRPQFDAQNYVTLIDFETEEEAKYYAETEKRYLEKKAKLAQDIESGEVENGGIWELVLMNERCMSAEFIRAPHLAKKMYEAWQQGYAAVCAVKYKRTLIKVVQILMDKYGVSRDAISLIWGGGQTKLNKKQKLKSSLTAKTAALEALGMDVKKLMEEMALEQVEERVLEDIPEHYRLGAQSQEERQKEIDKFQSGKSEFCLYSFKAGGVGLSLHHTDEFTTQKVRKKESGYAVEEDIPLIPVRPRKNFVAPTYSAIELVQGLGRCPRLTSLSHTIQELIFYNNTIEVDVAQIVQQKLRCLSKVVKMREKWADVIDNRGATKVHTENTKDLVDDPDDLTNEEEEEE